MTLALLVALDGPWESRVVAALSGHPDVEVARRCADLPDLLASAAAGHGEAALVSADLRGLDADVLQRLTAAGVAVVGVCPPEDEDADRRLRRIGVVDVLPADRPAEELAQAVATAVDHLRRDPGASRPDPDGSPDANGRGEHPGLRHLVGIAEQDDQDDRVGAVLRAERAFGDPARALADRPARADPVGGHPDGHPGSHPGGHPGPAGEGRGRLVAVWGPAGAPGRTTVAIQLAAELAALGHDTLLADADPYGGAVAQSLGLLDDAAGLAAACRAATHGSLDLQRLARLSPTAGDRLRVLTGLTRTDRWPELRPAGLERVWELARLLARWTVADCGFALEQDEEVSFDTAAPRRNGATLATLQVADVVLAVGRGDPLGLQRLVRGLSGLTEVTPVPPVVVVTRVRSSAVGARPEQRVRDALARYADVHDVVVVPEDQDALDEAMLRGQTLRECAPGSPARVALAELAQRLAGPRRTARGRRSRGSRRSAEAEPARATVAADADAGDRTLRP